MFHLPLVEDYWASSYRSTNTILLFLLYCTWAEDDCLQPKSQCHRWLLQFSKHWGLEGYTCAVYRSLIGNIWRIFALYRYLFQTLVVAGQVVGHNVLWHLVSSLSFLFSSFLTPLIALHHSSFDLPTASPSGITLLCLCNLHLPRSCSDEWPAAVLHYLLLGCFSVCMCALKYFCCLGVLGKKKRCSLCRFFDVFVGCPILCNLGLFRFNVRTPRSCICSTWSTEEVLLELEKHRKVFVTVNNVPLSSLPWPASVYFTAFMRVSLNILI